MFTIVERRLPVGAEPMPDGAVHFRVWAPRRRRVAVVLEGGPGRGRRVELGPGHYLQNHDQIANTGRGRRAHQLTSPGRYRALTTLLLLAPQTPMLFQGQEFAASTPFRYFNDASPELADPVRKGRVEFLSQFESLAEPGMRARLPDPADPETFLSCKLDLAERERHGGIYALHRDLLRLRREDPVFAPMQRRGAVDGAVLADEAFLLRYLGGGDDRLLLVNLGRDLVLDPAPEPLLAPLEGRSWRVLWSSEDPRYGGIGIRRIGDEKEAWRLTGHSAVVLAPCAPAAGSREERG